MSILDNYTTATRPSASSNTGLCIFNTDNDAIEVSDGTNYLTYLNDGVLSYYGTNTKALEFDGIGDYVSIADDSTLDLTGDFSITMWINMDTQNQFNMFISKRASSGHAWQFYVSNNSLPNQRIHFNNGGGIKNSNTGISAGTWHHIGMTFSSGSVTFYLNGSADGTATSTNTTNPTNTEDVTIGKAYNGNFVDGKIDEVAIFNAELSAAQISNIYNHKVYPQSDILSFWRFEDDVTDSVGSNDGTKNGATFVTDKPY